MLNFFLLSALGVTLVTSQSANDAYSIPVQDEPLSDPGTAGPPPEIVHLYYDYWPTGIAVSSCGRKFSNYPPGLDAKNNNYTVAELTTTDTEAPYPSLAMNSPPGGKFNFSTTPTTGANYQDYLIGVQSVVIDPADRLWILDTGRAALPDGTMVPASYGGPKLIGINLTDDSVFQNIIFTPEAAPSASYLNDVRFDLNPDLTESGQGVAYITDSSAEGENAIIIVDLGTKEAWRHLKNAPAVSATIGFIPTIWGQSVYNNMSNGQPAGNVNFGCDGIAISPDGCTLYWSTTGGREFYSIPTSYLRDRSTTSEIRANAAINHISNRGLSDGMETDSNGRIYHGSIEDNAIGVYFPENGTERIFLRDPRFSWTDTMSVGTDGYLYFTENQLWRSPAYHGGIDLRIKPYVLFRAKLPDAGTKVVQPVPDGTVACYV